MKKLLITILPLITINALSQTKPGHTKFNSKNEAISYWADSIANTPVRDTTSAAIGVGERRLRIARTDTTEYIWTGQRWKPLGGNGTDSAAVLSTGISQARKKNNTYYNVLDSLTGEYVTYKKATKWLDGSIMSDRKVDNVWFIKVGNEFYERKWPNGVVNLAAYGVTPDSDNSHFNTDNAPKIQSVFDYVPSQTPVSILLPPSTWAKAYYCHTTLKIVDKEISFFTYGHNTRIIFPSQTTGIYYTRVTGSSDFATFENIQVYSFIGSDPSYQFDGFKMEAVCKIVNCTANYFSGAGLRLSGSIAGSGTNVSGSLVDGFKAASCGDGVAIIGDDGNAVDLRNIDTRDCKRYGIRNAAFLTLNIFGWMSHYAGSGDYNSSDQNCSAVLVGPYWEGGSPISTARGKCTVIGGNIPINQLVPHDILSNVSFTAGNYSTNTWSNTNNLYHRRAIRQNPKGDIVEYWEGYPTNGIQQRNLSGLIGNESNWQKEWEQDTSIKLGGMMGYNVLYNWDGVSRFVKRPMINIQTASMQGRLVQSQTSLSNIIAGVYYPGDEVYIRPFTTNGVSKYVCIQQGSVFAGTIPFASNPNGTDTLFGVNGHSLLEIGEGDVFTVGGKQRTVIKKGGTQPFWIKVNSPLPVISTYDTLKALAPVWKEVGVSVGTTSNRPTISNKGIGYFYFNLDSNKMQSWTGVAWITFGGGSNGSVTSGTYRPTVSSTTNVSSSVTYSDAGYSRNGNQVYVNGKITVKPKAAGIVSFQISLPVSTGRFSSDGMAAGGIYPDNPDNATVGRVYATISELTVAFKYKALTTSSTDFSFSFSYTYQSP